MKAKFYLTALVLPALFAACTSEDFVEGPEGNKALAGRIILDNVTFAPEINTRFDYNESTFNQISYEDKDAIGAYLIDKPNVSMVAEGGIGEDEEATLQAGYDLVTNIQANHQFVYDGMDKTWTTLDNMEEGNYLYILPYMKKPIRSDIKTKLPQVQQLAFKEGTTEIDERSLMRELIKSGEPVAVGYQFLNRVNQRVNVQMKHIYAYPQITFENKLSETVTVQKIVISSSAQFALEGTIKLAESSGAPTNAHGSVVGKLFNVGSESAWGTWATEKASAWYTTDNKTEDILKDLDNKVDYIVVKAPAGMTVAANGKVSFMAIIPANAYAQNDLVIDVYTDKGVFQETIDGGASGIYINNGMRYLKSEYDRGSMDSEKTGKTLVVAETVPATLSTSVVSDTEDLIACIKGAIAAEQSTLTVSPMDANSVEINKDVVSAIGNSDLAVIFSSAVGIAGGIEADPLAVAGFEFKENATVNSGYVTMGTGNTVANSKKLIIAAGASATVAAGTYAEIVNNGTLTIANKQATITKLTNAGSATFNDDLSTAANWTNTGTITVPQGKILTIAVAFENEGTIENNGNIVATSALTNSGTLNNSGIITGIVTNKKNLSNKATGRLTGTVTNGASGNSGVNAVSIIDTEAGSLTAVNENFGTINYTEGIRVSVNDNQGTVIYTTPEGFAEANLATIPTVCNYLKLTQPLNYKDGTNLATGIEKVELDANVTVAAGQTLALPAAVSVSGKHEFSGAGKITIDTTAGGTLKFNENSSTDITDITIDRSTSDSNYYKITLDGASVTKAVVYNFGVVQGVESSNKGTLNDDDAHWIGADIK